VIGAIEDRQGLFNLNNVVGNVAQFQRLLAVLGLPADLAPALADWTDGDSEPQAGGRRMDIISLWRSLTAPQTAHWWNWANWCG